MKEPRESAVKCSKLIYEIKRQNGRLVITKGTQAVFNAPEDSYVIYEKNGENTANQVKDLPDDQQALFS